LKDYVKRTFEDIGIDPTKPLGKEDLAVVAKLVETCFSGEAFEHLTSNGVGRQEAIEMIIDTFFAICGMGEINKAERHH
jgi:hypothetical protein